MRLSFAAGELVVWWWNLIAAGWHSPKFLTKQAQKIFWHRSAGIPWVRVDGPLACINRPKN
jgi:hypothetical protein